VLYCKVLHALALIKQLNTRALNTTCSVVACCDP